MKRTWVLRPVGVAALVLSALVASFGTSEAAPKSGKKPRAPRLPNYVARVVNDEQRTEISAIQVEYVAKIQKLRDELQALVDERDAEIDKVLTPTQRKEVQRLRDEAAAKRGSAKDKTKASVAKTKKKAKSGDSD